MLCGCVHDWCRPCSPELRDAVRLRARLVQAILTRVKGCCAAACTTGAVHSHQSLGMLCGCVDDWCRPLSPEIRDAVRLRARLVHAMLTRD
ncbi:hypothetical protein NDU88_000120 [Pleurodeles waltl]|uniref:Uncharacterized protein n=1 Tax=Pleurodeles waltl TaxID=8319 RepID=A0AAV7M1J2_PLEWA|nr:hypothetical protein NDU88_000120 [Pleurodeles waltl]